MGKIILCSCEDITLDELHTALAQGYNEIESLKRFTGIATGKCQGKCCLVQTLRALETPESVRAAARGRTAGPGEPLNPDDVKPGVEVRIPTIRQPVTPLSIDELAAGRTTEEDDA